MNRTTNGVPFSFEADGSVVMDGFRHLVGITKVGVWESFALEADRSIVVNFIRAWWRRRGGNARADHLTFLCTTERHVHYRNLTHQHTTAPNK